MPTTPTPHQSLYDFPKYYDLVYGSDWKAEFDFLEDCFDRHAERTVGRLFEPACGTGRLLFRFAQAGYSVAGNDLNPRTVDYANERLARHGCPPTAVVGDMSDFELSKPVDAAFNTINSFRHLTTERSARAHLDCVARALAPGGIYVLGLHLTPTAVEPMGEERWSVRRGHLGVLSHMWTIEVDPASRSERVGMTFDVMTPTRSFQLADEMVFRTYTYDQMADLIERTADLEIAATYDFAYRIDCPIQVGPAIEDVVYVLRKS